MQVLDFKKSYFDLFDIKVDFEVDKTVLHKRLQQLQAMFHPDRYVSANEQDKRLSVQQASWVNEAYQTLKNPVKRARYLLEVAGLELNDENQTTSDSTFLMEQIELREQLDACRTDEDPLSKCDQIEVTLKNRAQKLSDEFVHFFNSGDLNAARLISRKMQFIQRIQEQVAELQFELEEELG
jgi:molecular chaperone HscB